LDDGDSTTIKRELKDMQREAMINQITKLVFNLLNRDLTFELLQYGSRSARLGGGCGGGDRANP
jgi:hypothetical protein